MSIVGARVLARIAAVVQNQPAGQGAAGQHCLHHARHGLGSQRQVAARLSSRLPFCSAASSAIEELAGIGSFAANLQILSTPNHTP